MATGSRCRELPYWPLADRRFHGFRGFAYAADAARAAAQSAPFARGQRRACGIERRGAQRLRADGGAEQSHVSASRAVARRRGRRARRLPRRRRGALGRSVVRRFRGARCAGGGERRIADTRGGCRASGAVRLQLRRHRAVAARRYPPAAVRQPRVSNAGVAVPWLGRSARGSCHRHFRSRASGRRRLHAGRRRLERRRARRATRGGVTCAARATTGASRRTRRWRSQGPRATTRS